MRTPTACAKSSFTRTGLKAGGLPPLRFPPFRTDTITGFCPERASHIRPGQRPGAWNEEEDQALKGRDKKRSKGVSPFQGSDLRIWDASQGDALVLYVQPLRGLDASDIIFMESDGPYASAFVHSGSGMAVKEARTGSFGAAPGTTTPGTAGRRTATTGNPATATTTLGSASRVHPPARRTMFTDVVPAHRC